MIGMLENTIKENFEMFIKSEKIVPSLYGDAHNIQKIIILKDVSPTTSKSSLLSITAVVSPYSTSIQFKGFDHPGANQIPFLALSNNIIPDRDKVTNREERFLHVNALIAGHMFLLGKFHILVVRCVILQFNMSWKLIKLPN
ncbi:hypothetical protein RF11_09508 [Thelohanellus kitauei]|uniref:Uncharacterized protein n=1 Tax=Thelohanellus kitauei TaxID=669202 RepID=A0A0C2N0J2_THEKT|nr:hypothetical protein RF11_09508 [Thelohanellus kitauei]